jgi:hypothetical protein
MVYIVTSEREVGPGGENETLRFLEKWEEGRKEKNRNRMDLDPVYEEMWREELSEEERAFISSEADSPLLLRNRTFLYSMVHNLVQRYYWRRCTEEYEVNPKEPERGRGKGGDREGEGEGEGAVKCRVISLSSCPELVNRKVGYSSPSYEDYPIDLYFTTVYQFLDMHYGDEMIAFYPELRKESRSGARSGEAEEEGEGEDLRRTRRRRREEEGRDEEDYDDDDKVSEEEQRRIRGLDLQVWNGRGSINDRGEFIVPGYRSADEVSGVIRHINPNHSYRDPVQFWNISIAFFKISMEIGRLGSFVVFVLFLCSCSPPVLVLYIVPLNRSLL